MKYQVTVTKEGVSDKGSYRDDTIFKQSFEELDLAALAIFLNRRVPIEMPSPNPYVLPETVEYTGPSGTIGTARMRE